ncbi:hypothetical protein Efla_005532 [Eimeria flavescens]
MEQIEPQDNWRRLQLQLFGPTDFPEATGVALWGHEVFGRLLNTLVVFWSATCATKEETCRCNNREGCRINFNHHGKPSCLAPIYDGKLALEGERLCQGREPPTTHIKDKRCYFYSLEPEDGWGCGSRSTEPVGGLNNTAFSPAFASSDDPKWLFISQESWKRHGIRLGSSPGVRYGTLFVAQIDEQGRRQWVRPLAMDVPLHYAQEQRVAVSGGEVPSQGAVESQYSITVTREKWEMKDGEALVFPHCETIFLTASGEWKGDDVVVPNCDGCQYSSAFYHPVTHKWAALCVSTRLPQLGIFINGHLAVDSRERLRSEAEGNNTLEQTNSYFKDTDGRLIPGPGGSWVLVWREASWKPSQTEDLMKGSATLKAAVWKDEPGRHGFLGSPVRLFGPMSEARLGSFEIIALSLETALVMANDHLAGGALVAAVDLSGLSAEEPINKPAAVALQEVDSLNQMHRHSVASLSRRVASALGASNSSNPFRLLAKQMLELQHRELSDSALIATQQRQSDCEGLWVASSSTCPATCLQRYTFRSSTSDARACPWESTAFRLAHCEGGECPNWRERATLFVQDVATSSNLLLGSDLLAKLELTQARNSFIFRLGDPVDLEGVEVSVHPADALLELNILDADDNWLHSISISLKAPLVAGAAKEPWVIKDLLLRRVTAFEVKATPTTADDASSLWSIGISELRLLSTPSLPCAGGGFSVEEKGCQETLHYVDTVEELDCKGEWGEWSICDYNCTRRRLFQIHTLPKRGGKPCFPFAVEGCAGSGLCLLAEQSSRQFHGTLLKLENYHRFLAAEAFSDSNISTDCVSELSQKSQCFSCRTFQSHQIKQQGKGKGKPCPADPFVLDFCDLECATVYGSNTTTTTATAAFLLPFYTTTFPESSLQDVESFLFLLKTLAAYLALALLACIVTAYMVEFFKTEPSCPAERTDRSLNCFGSLRPEAPSTRGKQRLVPTAREGRILAIGRGDSSCKAAPAPAKRRMHRCMRLSGQSNNFTSKARKVRQSVLGGNLLRDLTSSDSDGSSFGKVSP